jgi:hypothetical protein
VSVVTKLELSYGSNRWCLLPRRATRVHAAATEVLLICSKGLNSGRAAAEHMYVTSTQQAQLLPSTVTVTWCRLESRPHEGA